MKSNTGKKKKKHLKLFLKVHCSDKHLEKPLCRLESEHSCHANEDTQTFQYLRNAGYLVWLLKTLFLVFKQTESAGDPDAQHGHSFLSAHSPCSQPSAFQTPASHGTQGCFGQR